ncbi:uncharacterized protein LOC143617946 [Bidens hawaiensis]|uniref:uncharacterized protein LOC143617946 n=1 Tax=Bidens hawaiensis TaxID=980011 RepID=UPI004048FB1E
MTSKWSLYILDHPIVISMEFADNEMVRWLGASPSTHNYLVIIAVIRLEKMFRTTFSMLVVHVWLCLRRLKVEGKEGVELGQYVHEIFNHDLEIRVSKARVNLLLSKWMRELEKIFYGNIVAYDTAMLPEAKPDELHNTIWKNVFSNDGSPTFDAAALPAVLAFSRYVRRECTCLSLTDKESMFSGNFKFTTFYNPNTPV